MLVQFSSIKSERNQHLMMSFVFLIFIIYSLYAVLYISLIPTICIISFLVFGVYFFMKQQLNNRTVIQLQLMIKLTKGKSLKRNRKWIIGPFVIYSLLTIAHFLVVYSSGESIMSLVYDYGIGGVLAVGFNFYMSKNWNVGICDDGVIFGSKLDSKLIKWKYIEYVNYLPTSIEIVFIKNYPLDLITISNSTNLSSFEKLLKYKSL